MSLQYPLFYVIMMHSCQSSSSSSFDVIHPHVMLSSSSMLPLHFFFFQNILKQRAFLFLCLLQCYTQASDALLDLSFMACSKKAMASLGGLKKKFVKRLMPY